MYPLGTSVPAPPRPPAPGGSPGALWTPGGVSIPGPHAADRHSPATLTSAKSFFKPGGTVQQVVGATGVHSYGVEEATAFASHINAALSSDARFAGHLPVSGTTLFAAVADGLILCRLINLAVPDSIDERVLSWPAGKGGRAVPPSPPSAPTTAHSKSSTPVEGGSTPPRPSRALNPFQMGENVNLALSSARAIGCKVVNVHAADILSGATPGGGNSQHITLGVVWQVVRAQLLSRVNLKEHPELARLLLAGETVRELLALPPESLLLRWVNFHLSRHSPPRPPIHNLSADVKDGDAYWHVLASIDKSCLPKGMDVWAGGVQNASPDARAAAVIRAASTLGCPTFLTPVDVTSGNKRLNLAFTASLFNTSPGLAELPAEEEGVVLTAVAGTADAEADAREARQFRLWLNSLALGPPGGEEPLYIHSLFPELADGRVLLYALEKVGGVGTVDWARANTGTGKGMNRWREVENCNLAVTLGRGLGFSLPGIAGSDLHDGNPKLCLGFLWQLMRLQLTRMLATISGGGPAGGGGGTTPGTGVSAPPSIKRTAPLGSAGKGEVDVLGWANEAVSRAVREGRVALSPSCPPPPPASSFKDPALSTGHFLLSLLASVHPDALDASLVTPGETSEDKAANAKYVISIARKLGVVAFVTWEDLTEVKPKAVQQLLSALMYHGTTRGGVQRGGGPDTAPQPSSTTTRMGGGAGRR